MSSRTRADRGCAVALLWALGLCGTAAAQDTVPAAEAVPTDEEAPTREEASTDEAGPTQAEWITRASALEDESRPAEARAAWRSALDADPRSRLARRAERRLAWLDERSEGAFEPLAALWAFQQLPVESRDRAALEAFEAVTSEMPDGRVRAESALALAAAWDTAGDTERSVAAYRALGTDDHLDEAERSAIAEEIARVYAGAGHLDEAIAELEGTGGDAGTLSGLHRASRRRVLEPLAWALVALFVLAVGFVVARSPRPKEALRAAVAPTRLLVAAQLALAPLALATFLRDDAAGAFEGLAVVAATTLFGTSAAGEALEGASLGRRSALGALCVLAVLAGAYLSIAYLGPALRFG